MILQKDFNETLMDRLQQDRSFLQEFLEDTQQLRKLLLRWYEEGNGPLDLDQATEKALGLDD